jgi:hypothetical protein
MPSFAAARAIAISPSNHSRPAAPEQRGVHAAVRHVHQGAVVQRDAFERRAVGAQRQLIFGAAIDKLEQPLRQAPFRNAPKIFGVERAVDVRPHLRPPRGPAWPA